MITDLGYQFPIDDLEADFKRVVNPVAPDEYDSERNPGHFAQFTVYRDGCYFFNTENTIIEHVIRRVKQEWHVHSACIRVVDGKSSGNWHTDDVMGIHVPLTENPMMFYDFEHVSYTMEQGRMYLFDSTVKHRIRNEGTTNRYNLHLWVSKDSKAKIKW